MANRSVSYDPGKPQAARLVNQHEQLYAIDSFRGEGKSYLVNLKHGRCDCPDFRKRGHERPCKHLAEVRRQARFIKLLTTARSLSDSDLARLLARYTERGDPETAGALRVAREERRQAAKAAAPRPIGASVKLWGPTTDAEARAAFA